MAKTHYDALGIQKDATRDEIKAAYRKKARLTHPDTGGNAAEFHQVQEAYRILSNGLFRREYDATLFQEHVQSKFSQAYTPPPRPQTQAQRPTYPRATTTPTSPPPTPRPQTPVEQAPFFASHLFAMLAFFGLFIFVGAYRSAAESGDSYISELGRISPWNYIPFLILGFLFTLPYAMRGRHSRPFPVYERVLLLPPTPFLAVYYDTVFTAWPWNILGVLFVVAYLLWASFSLPSPVTLLARLLRLPEKDSSGKSSDKSQRTSSKAKRPKTKKSPPPPPFAAYHAS